MSELLSDNKRFKAVQQGDGNFVVYDQRDNSPVWSMFSYLGENKDGDNKPNNPPDNPPDNPRPNGDSNLVTIEENVNPIGMAYWRNIGNPKGRDELYVVLSVDDELMLYRINKSNLAVLGWKSLNIHHTGEGIYFSAIDYNILYVPINNILNRINVETGDRESVWRSNYNLWQCHTSYDERTHSASLKDDNWEIRYWGVSKDGTEKRYDLHEAPDECQIDKSGRFLTAKEVTRDEKLQNRVITLDSGKDITITNEQGSLGHSDCGFGFMIGENAKSNHAGALDYVNLETLHRQEMFSTGIWNMGYVSFCNAREGSLDNQYCLVTTPNELISVRLNGEKNGRKISDNFTQSQDYEKRPKANLDTFGEFAVWTAWNEGKMKAYLVRI